MVTLYAPGLQFDYLEVDVNYTGITGSVQTDEIQLAFGVDQIPESSTSLLSLLGAGLLFRRRK